MKFQSRLRFQWSRLSLFFIALAVMLSYPVMALAQEEDSRSTSSSSTSAPTIQSDKEDYRPGETVTLIGENWEPGENVNIWVNDDEGKSWSRNVDVTADSSGNVTDTFNLPDWFVAVYYVTATGDSGTVAKTTFTDGNVGIRNSSATPSNLTASYKLEGFDSTNCATGTENTAGNRSKTFSIKGPGIGTNQAGDLQVASGNNQSIKVSITKVDPTTQAFKQWNSFNGNTVSDGSLYGTQKSFCFQTQNNTNTTFVGLFQSANTAPVANNQTVTTNEDTSKLVTLSATDADNNTLTYKVTSLPTKGKLYKGDSTEASNEITSANTTLSGSTVTYVPNKDYNGSDSFKFSANDGTVDSSEVNVSITVNSVNDAPGFTKGANQAVNEDAGAQSVTGWATTISPGPSDELSQSVSFVASNDNNSLFSTQPAVSSSGTLSYTPAADKNGSATITVYAKDDGGTPNDPNDDVSSASQTFTITVTAVNDAPVAAAQSVSTNEDTSKAIDLSATDVDGDSLTYSIVAEPTNGTLTRTANGSYTYTPRSNYNGSDSFTFKASDGSLNSSAATVGISVTAVNDAPVAVEDADTTAEDTALDIDVLSNDTDADNDELSVSDFDANSAKGGTVAQNEDGTLKYTPKANFYGEDTFIYTVNDGTVDGNTVTVTITVESVNDAPVADAQAVSTDEDTALAGSLTASDTENDELTYSLVAQASHGTATVNSDGSFSYEPEENYNGPDSFTFKANDDTADSNTATVSITVNAVNDAPEADDQSASTDEDKLLEGDVTASDIEKDELTYSLVADAEYGTLVLNADGSFSYMPDENYNGPDSFTFKANDSELDSETATVSITVDPVNDAPVANDDAEQTAEDTPVSIEVLSNDTDADGNNDIDPATLQVTSGPSSGTTRVNDDGTITYTPNANFHGTDSFSYTVCDSEGECSKETVEVSVTVTSVNDAPEADNQEVSLAEDSSEEITLGGSDVDGDSLTYSIVNEPRNGTLKANTGGTYTYTPDENYNGPDSFTFKANDGELDSETATVSITVDPVNDTPEADAQSVSTNEDTAKAVTLGGKDIDGDALSYTVVSNPTNGTLSGTDANLTYTPKANYNGPDSFTFKVSDGTLDSSEAEVSITITPVNDAPEAKDDSAETDEDEAKDINVLDNDSDVENDTLSVASYTQPTNGTVSQNPNGTLKYTPKANFNGTDAFTYKAKDASLETDSATVGIKVNAVNDNPTISAAYDGPAKEGSPVKITANANDPEGDTLSYEFDCNNDGNYDNNPQSGSTYQCTFKDDGTYTVGVRAADGNGGKETATTNVKVDNVAPTLGNLTLSGNTGTACATNNVKLAFSFDDPAKANDAYNGTIDWGDGSSTDFGSSFSVNESHDYKPGTYTIKVNVSDEDGGKAAQKEAQVSRQYQMTKLSDPVNANADGKTPSVFKYGSTIPLKVKITDCQNNPVSGLAPKISIAKYSASTPTVGINETALNTSSHSDFVMRDAGSGQYIYNLASKSLSDGDAQYTATVTDASFGSMQSQVWGLRSK